MRIVVLDGYVENPGDLSWEPLGALGELTVYDRTPPAQVAERIGEAEIVFTNKSLIPEQVLDACPALRYIGVLATGYNVVDVEAAGRRGIVVTNIPSYGTETVAQFTMALLLEKYPRMTNGEAKLRLYQSCDDLGLPKSHQGWGRLNIERLLSLPYSASSVQSS